MLSHAIRCFGDVTLSFAALGNSLLLCLTQYRFAVGRFTIILSVYGEGNFTLLLVDFERWIWTVVETCLLLRGLRVKDRLVDGFWVACKVKLVSHFC